jgi:hypothetical protein
MSGRITSGSVVVVVLLLLLVGGAALGAQARAAAGEPVTPGSPPEPSRERDGDPAAPAISFIDSPTPTCYRPDPRTDTCFISWSYLYVNAAPSQNIISMTVAIDGRLVANHQGFFQSSMHVPGELYGSGFEVSCGVPGATGDPVLGRTHSYVLRARETGGLKAANYGAVTCPAGLERVYLPLTLR